MGGTATVICEHGEGLTGFFLAELVPGEHVDAGAGAPCALHRMVGRHLLRDELY
jgi:hypothetical protein